MSEEEVVSKDAWTMKHEWDGHSHEEREAPQWIYWVIVGFSLGVMAYLAYEQWRDSRKFQAAIDAWSVRARSLLDKETKSAQEVPDETPAATTGEAV